jgi:hypothetical protein
MYKIIPLFLLLTLCAGAQTKKPSRNAAAKKSNETVQDTLVPDTSAAQAVETDPLPNEFKVYTKKPKKKEDRMKLCLNLVSGDSIFNYCMNDSTLRDPEISKILFEQKDGDSTYVLVYVEAFSKPKDKPSCDAGRERKLFYVRWNTKTNKAIVKQKYFESCMKNITNMSKEPVASWDGTSVLTVNYYRGGINFTEFTFDPKKYLLGFQTTDELESR